MNDGAGEARTDGAGRHMLYIDDDAAMVLLVTRLLERRNFVVNGFTDASAAIALLRGDPCFMARSGFPKDLSRTALNVQVAGGEQAQHLFATVSIRRDQEFLLVCVRKRTVSSRGNARNDLIDGVFAECL
jgi:CheY-like chemotaxis protein